VVENQRVAVKSTRWSPVEIIYKFTNWLCQKKVSAFAKNVQAEGYKPFKSRFVS